MGAIIIDLEFMGIVDLAISLQDLRCFGSSLVGVISNILRGLC